MEVKKFKKFDGKQYTFDTLYTTRKRAEEVAASYRKGTWIQGQFLQQFVRILEVPKGSTFDDMPFLMPGMGAGTSMKMYALYVRKK